MKDQALSRRRRALALAALPLAAGVWLVAQPDAKANETCGYASAQVTGVGSVTVPLTTTCAPPCTGSFAQHAGPETITYGSTAAASFYLCVTP